MKLVLTKFTVELEWEDDDQRCWSATASFVEPTPTDKGSMEVTWRRWMRDGNEVAESGTYAKMPGPVDNAVHAAYCQVMEAAARK